MVTRPSYAHVVTPSKHTSTSEYMTLWHQLIEVSCNIDTIRESLNDHRLTETQLRMLFAHIRQPVIDILWEHRQLELWIFRAEKLGVVYATANSEDDSVAKWSSKYAFQREQDELLNIEDGGPEETRDMIMQHVEVLREGSLRLVELRRKKAAMLPASRSPKMAEQC